MRRNERMSTTHAYQADDDKQSRHTVKYFMWAYQPHAHTSMAIAAERLFGALTPGLNPTVRLVGFLDEEREGRLPICVEPDDDRYAPDQFAGVKSIAESLQTTDTGMMYLHPSKDVAARF